MSDTNTCTCVKMDEVQKLNDLLASEKYMTGVYNTYCCEAYTGCVKSSLLSILQDEHHMQEEIFNTLNQKGLYPVEKAEENKLTAARQKFASKVSK